MRDEKDKSLAMDVAGVALAVSLFSIFLSMISGGDTTVTTEGLTGHDLTLAVMRCAPPSATFEQDLACYQAIYGGHRP